MNKFTLPIELCLKRRLGAEFGKNNITHANVAIAVRGLNRLFTQASEARKSFGRKLGWPVLIDQLISDK